ncbi:MAG: DUF1987 domain-containing protein [Flavobacteriales bacterium]|nr:DUF1987 domain-containing protein [Flavobacteriales bacterium]
MNPYFIPATDSSPEVYFDLQKNIFQIRGKSVFTDADKFYSSAIEWLKSAEGKLKGQINFIFDLEYFNIISSKRILFVLYTLNEMRAKGIEISITWNFSLDDDDMREVGEDYSYMVNIPFQFVCKQTETEIL